MSKSGTHFHFKQFSIRHDRCSMKVGTDGVLLGAWVNVAGATSILDIGTGSGVIAVMLAQRTLDDVRIDAVEVEPDDAQQAKENVQLSRWPEKITIYNQPIQQFHSDQKYDVIVSNPPYFVNSQKPPGERRTQTRHTTSLDHDTLLMSVLRLLKDNGRFSVVLPFTEGLQFIELATNQTLYCCRKYSFRTRREKPIERWLLEFSREVLPEEEGEILLYSKDVDWSDDYLRLTKDFYLKI